MNKCIKQFITRVRGYAKRLLESYQEIFKSLILSSPKVFIRLAYNLALYPFDQIRQILYLIKQIALFSKKQFVIVTILTVALSFAYVMEFESGAIMRSNFFVENNTTIFSIFGTLVGFSLYILRETFRWLYGLIELSVGIGTIYLNLPKIQESASFGLFAVLGGIYIIVRACDNLDKAPADYGYDFLIRRTKD